MLPIPTEKLADTVPPAARCKKQELDRPIKSGHLERLETIEDDCFVSPVVLR